MNDSKLDISHSMGSTTPLNDDIDTPPGSKPSLPTPDQCKDEEVHAYESSAARFPAECELRVRSWKRGLLYILDQPPRVMPPKTGSVKKCA
jgi:hypothetical protein